MKQVKAGFLPLILIIGVSVGFLAGARLAPTLSWKLRPAPSQPSLSGLGESQRSDSAREMMDAISSVFERAASEVGSSCAAIIAEQWGVAQDPSGAPADSRLSRRPAQGDEGTSVSLGSGVIVSPDGLILTNNHVVSESEKVLVALRDGKTYPAKIIGTDPETDLAVIKIDAEGLHAASFGDSDQIMVGQWVVAVGNPLGMMHTVTAGIVSAIGRSSVGLAAHEDLIQTDASINPGNSGGALADLNGKVIGINTAIASPSGGSVGVGLAIPVNRARQVMDALVRSVQRAPQSRRLDK